MAIDRSVTAAGKTIRQIRGDRNEIDLLIAVTARCAMRGQKEVPVVRFL